MELFKRRPLCLICFTAVALTLTALNTNNTLRSLIIATLALSLFICFVLLICLFKNNSVHTKRISAVIVFILISLLMVVSADKFADKYAFVDLHAEEPSTVVGTITEVRFKSSDNSSFKANVSSVNNFSTNLNIILEINGHSSLKSGDEFSAYGIMETLSTDGEAYIISDGYSGKFLCASSADVRLRGVQQENTGSFFSHTNSFFQDVLYKHTDENVGSLAGAFLLGNRDRLNSDIIRDFGRCGLSHMLALSGLHMSIIIGFFDIIMRNLLIDKRFRCIILAFLAVVYLAITGFSPSATRAVIMLCIVYFSYLISSDTDSVTALFIALVIILLFSPYAAYDVGLWMSFFATLGILVISGLVSSLKYKIKKKPFHIQLLIRITVAMAVTMAAVFSTCIFTWIYFGEISLISPFMNLIMSPLMTLILVAGLLVIIFSFIPFVAGFLGGILTFLTTGFIETVSSVSAWRGITVSLKYDFVPFIVIPLVLSLLVITVIKIKRKRLITLPPLIAVIAFVIALSYYNSANADFCDIIYLKEKNSESLIVTTLGETSICDISTGGYSNFNYACTTASKLEYLTEIENYIITHYHSYHSSSLVKICNKYFIRNVYLPLPEDDEERVIYNELLEALKSTSVNTIVYKRGADIKDRNENVISVSECSYIERSTHPIFTVTVSSETKSFVYSTSAFLEANVLEYADVMILGSHGATVKPLKRTAFSSAIASSIPSAILFTSPYEMLGDDDIISYVHYLYQNGHTIIIDGKDFYKFSLN